MQNFLIEGNDGRAKIIDEITFTKILNTKCTDSFRAFKDFTRFYRGTKTAFAPTLHIDPKVFTRSSKDNQNYYTLIMSHDTTWKRFPPRNKSIIATTNSGTAEAYGKPYIVFPFNGSRIGIAPSNDIWSSWKDTLSGSNLIPLLDSLEQLFLGVNMADEANESIKGLKDACSRVNPKIITGQKASRMKQGPFYLLANSIPFDKKEGLYKWLTKVFSPEKFTTIKAGDSFRGNNNEIWTDGECLLCTFDALFEIKSKTDIIVK